MDRIVVYTPLEDMMYNQESNMIDPYSMLIEMAVKGEPTDVIAKATGWPADAVTTMVEELATERNADMDVMYFDGADDEDSARRWR